MAGWVSYTRKVLTSALTSIAGELEQTAQDFNDAVQTLSRPAPVDEPSPRDSDDPAVDRDLLTAPPTNTPSEATSIPEHMRGLPSSSGGLTPPGPTDLAPSLGTDQRSAPAGPSSARLTSEGLAVEERHDRDLPPPSASRSTSYASHCPASSRVSQLQPHCHGRVNTATTRQPGPSGRPASTLPSLPNPALPPRPLHSRLSHSSPSLSPLSHEGEDDGSGASSDAEDNLDLPQLPGHGSDLHLPGVRTPRPIRGETQRPMAFSVSTPCLLHMHKILPSCKKNFSCASSSSTPVKHARLSAEAGSNPRELSLTSNGCPRPSHMSFPESGAGDEGHRRNTCSLPGGRKKPGKVVVVVSQPPSSLEVCDHTLGVNSGFSCAQAEDGLQTGSGYQHGTVVLPECGRDKQTPQGDRDNPRSDSPQDQLVPRTVKSPVQIERETRGPRWTVLTPLARVLTFAYSQVVSAILLLQEEESSTSSGTNRSRASSLSRQGDRYVTSPGQSRAASPVQARATSTQSGDAASDILPGGATQSYHRRQASQLSLAGSTFSSESFEILDLADMESSNFVCVGEDATDILHEYHLFPSSSSAPPAHHSATTAATASSRLTALTTNVQGSAGADLMTSSSADFAHFDFRELISDRRNNTLNPFTGERSQRKDAPEVSSSAGQLCDLRGGSDSPAGEMFESFVVLEVGGEIPSKFGDGAAGGDGDGGDSDTASISVISDGEGEPVA